MNTAHNTFTATEVITALQLTEARDLERIESYPAGTLFHAVLRPCNTVLRAVGEEANIFTLRVTDELALQDLAAEKQRKEIS